MSRPMIDAAAALSGALLDRAGHKRSLLPDGDPLRVWAESVWIAVRHEPGAELAPPPREADGASLTAIGLRLPLIAWLALGDATAVHDHEGDATADEHATERARRLAAWPTDGLLRLEAMLAEALPAVAIAALEARALEARP